MILVDLNQVMISNLMAQLGAYTNIEVEEGLLRHMVLNALRLYRNKFSAEYGELVICCDDKNYWRKSLFPYYKAHRKKAREDSDLNWPQIFTCLNAVRDELRETFPYKNIQVQAAEADDIIGTLCHEYGKTLLNGDEEKILILSGDKDFMQLQKFANVAQYDPIRKRMLKTKDPIRYLHEHVLKGDRGDGIPNFLSNGDVFVTGGRQKPLRQKVIDEVLSADWPEDWTGMTDTLLDNFKRNRMLVDLAYTPNDIKLNILEQFNQQPNDRSGLFNYFVQKKLTNLMENISEF